MNKKWIALILAAIIVAAFSACAKEEPEHIMEVPAVVQESVPGIVSGEDDGSLDDVTVIVAETKETTESVDSSETEETVASTEGTEATEAAAETGEKDEPDQDEATEPVEKPTESVKNMTQYEWYNSLSGDEQMAFMESFDSVPAFFEWYNAAKEEHEKQNPSIEIGDDVIDLGEIIGGNG